MPKARAEDDIEPNPKVDEDIGADREGSRTGESPQSKLQYLNLLFQFHECLPKLLRSK